MKWILIERHVIIRTVVLNLTAHLLEVLSSSYADRDEHDLNSSRSTFFSDLDDQDHT